MQIISSCVIYDMYVFTLQDVEVAVQDEVSTHQLYCVCVYSWASKAVVHAQKRLLPGSNNLPFGVFGAQLKPSQDQFWAL